MGKVLIGVRANAVRVYAAVAAVLPVLGTVFHTGPAAAALAVVAAVLGLSVDSVTATVPKSLTSAVAKVEAVEKEAPAVAADAVKAVDEVRAIVK